LGDFISTLVLAHLLLTRLIDNLQTPRFPYGDLLSCTNRRGKTEFGMNGIIKGQSVYFMSSLDVWGRQVCLFSK
jgi:hypothetical protein